jgi:hypothetical protein
MTFILDSLQMVVLILGAAAVLAFLLHNMRSRPSPAFPETNVNPDRAVSPTVLAKRLAAAAEQGEGVLLRIQTPSASDSFRIRRLLVSPDLPEADPVAVENGVVISWISVPAHRVKDLAPRLLTLLHKAGVAEGSCHFRGPARDTETLLTWILRGDGRAASGPLRMVLDESIERVDPPQEDG